TEALRLLGDLELGELELLTDEPRGLLRELLDQLPGCPVVKGLARVRSDVLCHLDLLHLVHRRATRSAGMHSRCNGTCRRRRGGSVRRMRKAARCVRGPPACGSNNPLMAHARAIDVPGHACLCR